MASTLQNSTILLSRLLSLKENSPFLLCIDTLSQSSYHFQLEFIHKLPRQSKVIYLSFETLERPEYATEFISCLGLKVEKIIESVKGFTKDASHAEKSVILIDSLNYIDPTILSSFISSLFSPFITIFATYHSSIPVAVQSQAPNYPHPLQLLQFIASTIFEIYPILLREHDEETIDNASARLNFIVNQCNKKTFKIVLNNRRKSGRSLIYHLKVNTQEHVYEIYRDADHETTAISSEEELFKNLTTFNLNTSSKQKLARDQVELPFLEAQSFGSGGAIVYEFEKDDDYDEDDPYEDPF